MAECPPLDVLCEVGNGVGDIISAGANDTLQELTNRALEGFGQAVASAGTMWVNVPTPVLTGGTGDAGGGTPPGSGSAAELLGYVMWIGIAICVLSIVGVAYLMIVRSRRGDGGQEVLGRLGFVLLAVVLISGGSALVAFLLPSRAPDGSSSATGFIQNSLWFYVGVMAVFSVFVAAIRMAWEQRANPGRELLQSLLTLLVVSGAGLTIIGLAVAATDAFSVWVLNSATGCDVSDAGQSTCFGTNITSMIALSTGSGIGLLTVLILAVIALIMTVVQVALMIVRGGLLVVLAGVLPLTASFTTTQMGRMWFQRAVGWTIAFILYKPAAALIYAAAFRLVGSDALAEDGSGLVAIITGMGLMLLALFALPALLRFVTPMTAAVLGGSGGGLAMGAMAAAGGVEVATGAISRTSSSTLSAGGGSPTAGPTGAAGATGARGAGAASASGAAAGGSGAAAGGGAAAGAGAAGGAAAAAGPIGAGIAAGAQVVGSVGQAVKGAATSAADTATGEPTGA